jgi:uncharacterized protein
VSARTRFLGDIPPWVILPTLAMGGTFGLIAGWLGLPLPMMLGSMLGTAFAAGFGLRFGGRLPAVPNLWRQLVVPIIGVAIGAGFPPSILNELQRWWISIALLFVAIPAAQLLAFWLYRGLGRLDKKTAFFAAMPGGFIEAIEMAEKSGGDLPMVISLQMLRLILAIVFIPIGFSLFVGHAVGSASGVPLPGSDHALVPWDWAVLTALGALGWFLGDRLRMPAAVMFGPLLLSAIAHAAGFTEAAPPGWTILVAQWVLGTSLGCRLGGLSGGQMGRALGLAVLNAVVMLSLAAVIAVLFQRQIDEPVMAIILAFAPGGVTEMSLVALSLQLSAVYVSIHHMIRILLAVAAARLLQGPVIGD